MHRLNGFWHSHNFTTTHQVVYRMLLRSVTYEWTVSCLYFRRPAIICSPHLFSCTYPFTPPPLFPHSFSCSPIPTLSPCVLLNEWLYSLIPYSRFCLSRQALSCCPANHLSNGHCRKSNVSWFLPYCLMSASLNYLFAGLICVDIHWIGAHFRQPFQTAADLHGQGNRAVQGSCEYICTISSCSSIEKTLV